ncbi:MAG: cupin domain-containing protein [Roseovarius sp.]
MKPIETAERRVVNLKSAQFEPWDATGELESGTGILQLNPDAPRGTGFYIYKMEPGSRSTPHRHGGAEEFLILEGTLIDNDGTVYEQGDVVWLAPGTEHTSHTETGCLIAVYAEGDEVTLKG